MFWLFAGALPTPWRTTTILLWLGLFFFAILTIRLKDTPFTVGGINGDARFYTTYVTKMAAYPGYGDMFYKDLPAFYPPLYYFVVGRVADWFAIEPFRVMKGALLVTVMALPLFTGWLWRRLVDERIAAAVALCMLVFPDWFKPNEWLALALFVPWWLHWVDNVTHYQPRGRVARWRWWLVGGLIGAIILQLYFFWLFVGGTTLGARIGWWLCCRRRDRVLRQRLMQSVLMLALTALLSAPFWVPYLLIIFVTTGAQPLQNRFFGASKIPLPLYFFEENWQSVVYLGGLFYILVAAPLDRVARGLRWLLVGFALWVGLGYVAILIDMTLLTFRSYPVLAYLLGAGAFLGLFRLWQNSNELMQRWPAIPWRLVATTLLMLVILLFANNVVQEVLAQENVQDAVEATYPAEELASFDQLTAGNYRDRVIFVTDGYRSILFFRPIYSFLAWSAHFSHPAGQFHQRVDFLKNLASLHDPLLFAQALAHNQYDQIDYWLLAEEAEHWHFSFVDDNFPNRVVDREINFPKTLFVEPYFQTSRVDSYAMLKPGDLPPLPDSAQFSTEDSLDAVARAYLLSTRFAADLPLPNATELRADSEALLQDADLTALPVALLLDLQPVATGAAAAAVNQALASRLQWPEPVTLVDDTGVPSVQLLGYQL
ncbi:MAG: arabinofuranosyltransferase, partial [Caldilineaceae bacterium]|nr:arabinofuranosyltransferase [Caldilineaceae bacterium]